MLFYVPFALLNNSDKYLSNHNNFTAASEDLKLYKIGKFGTWHWLMITEVYMSNNVQCPYQCLLLLIYWKKLHCKEYEWKLIINNNSDWLCDAIFSKM